MDNDVVRRSLIVSSLIFSALICAPYFGFNILGANAAIASDPLAHAVSASDESFRHAKAPAVKEVKVVENAPEPSEEPAELPPPKESRKAGSNSSSLSDIEKLLKE